MVLLEGYEMCDMFCLVVFKGFNNTKLQDKVAGWIIGTKFPYFMGVTIYKNEAFSTNIAPKQNPCSTKTSNFKAFPSFLLSNITCGNHYPPSFPRSNFGLQHRPHERA